MTERGKYIVLEGGEGTGKTTQANRLVSELIGRGRPAYLIEEPGGDTVGQVLRSLLKQDPDDEWLKHALGGTDYSIEPKTELLLFNAARVQSLVIVRHLLEQGTWVVSGRNKLSTLAYQCYGRSLDLEAGRQICDWATEDLDPDVILLLDVAPKVADDRRSSRGQTDRFEAAGEDFHARVRRGYLAEANRSNTPVIDATGTQDDVHARIWQYLQPLLSERG